MKRIIVLGLLITSGFFCEAKAQAVSTNILRIEIDGKEVRKSYQVFFLSNDKWVEAEKTSTGFVVPGELKTEEHLTVLITFGKQKLWFPDIHISKFNTDWIVGIDKKPYSDEFIRPEEAKITKRVYYIQFLGVGLVTQMVVTEKKND